MESSLFDEEDSSDGSLGMFLNLLSMFVIFCDLSFLLIKELTPFPLQLDLLRPSLIVLGLFQFSCELLDV